MATATVTETVPLPVAPNTEGSPSTEPAPQEPGLTTKQTKDQKLRFPKPPTFNDKYEERKYLKRRLTLAFRLFGKYGFDEGVAGHITIRDPVDPTTFWVNPFGVPFSMINSSDLIHVDHEGEVIGGGRDGKGGLLNIAAFMIHSAVHAARPDVDCAAHSHSVYGRAFTTLGRELDTITQDSCLFYKDHSVYRQFKGIVLAAEEGHNIAAALGSNKAVLLQNHGLLTVGSSIEATIYAFTALETSCKAQLLADAAVGGRGGATIKIDDEDAAYTYKAIGSQASMWFGGQPMFTLMENELKGETWDDQ